MEHLGIAELPSERAWGLDAIDRDDERLAGSQSGHSKRPPPSAALTTWPRIGSERSAVGACARTPYAAARQMSNPWDRGLIAYLCFWSG
jgi:hypothetical protein